MLSRGLMSLEDYNGPVCLFTRYPSKRRARHSGSDKRLEDVEESSFSWECKRCFLISYEIKLNTNKLTSIGLADLLLN